MDVKEALKEQEGKGFSKGQMRQIRLGLESGLDVSVYAKPKFISEYMRVIREEIELKIMDANELGLQAHHKFNFKEEKS